MGWNPATAARFFLYHADGALRLRKVSWLSHSKDSLSPPTHMWNLQNMAEQAVLLDFALPFLRQEIPPDVKPPSWATQGWAARPITPELVQELENRVLLLSITAESGL